jgi:hypothetical protein
VSAKGASPLQIAWPVADDQRLVGVSIAARGFGGRVLAGLIDNGGIARRRRHEDGFENAERERNGRKDEVAEGGVFAEYGFRLHGVRRWRVVVFVGIFSLYEGVREIKSLTSLVRTY